MLSENDIYEALPNDLTILSEEDRSFLVRPMTSAEVVHTLKPVPKGKSPGPDGLNVAFYLFYWQVIGVHLFKAINFFFQNDVLPSS